MKPGVSYAQQPKPARPQFLSQQDGNVTIFSVFMLVLILTIAGASVDIMRYEATRAEMQNTMDRAVLAAADLDQLQDPEAVVRDYLNKLGLENFDAHVEIDEALNYRTVTASGGADLESMFLQMAGFDSLRAPALSTAEEKISNVEISVVLDVSGSMNGSRISNMRDAAREFVDTVVQPAVAGAGLTSVSIIPYNATVNLGTTVGPLWTLSNQHDYSNCAIFDASDFDDVAISPVEELERLAHFDLNSTNKNTHSIPNPWCNTGNESAVIVHSSDAERLKSHISSLQAGGNTAIDLGMKWGVGLLDPAARPVVSALAQADLVEEQAATRPAGYNDPEAIKFVVVMTDGENTSEYDLKHEFKFGMSDIWIDDRGNSNPSDDRFSVLVDDNNGSHNDVYFWHRYENSDRWSSRNRNYPDGGDNARRMSNAELYARFGTRAVAQKFYVKPYYDGWISYNRYYDIYYGYEEIVNGNQADQRLHNICSAAKDEGIVIFAIAFEAPYGGQVALKDCASSPSHYFDVAGVEITETFHSIARQINSLRLVQ